MPRYAGEEQSIGVYLGLLDIWRCAVVVKLIKGGIYLLVSLSYV